MSFLTALAAVVAAATVTLPPTPGAADYQLGGAYPPDAAVQIVTRDSTEAPDPDRYSICYVNAFQTQPGTIGWWRKHHPSLLLRDRGGRAVRDRDWPDEVLLDISTAARRAELIRVVDRWFAGCAARGFDAVEPDNLDSFTRSGGRLTSAHAVWFARTLVARAHARGLAIAQKNTPELSTRRIGFDFAVAEECEVYRECGDYARVFGTRLIEIEYTDNGRSAFTRACATRSGRTSISLRDRDLAPRGTAGYAFRAC